MCCCLFIYPGECWYCVRVPGSRLFRAKQHFAASWMCPGARAQLFTACFRVRIRKRLFGIFTMRQKWFHKHTLFCKYKVSQDWMQRYLLVETFPGFPFLYEFSLHLLCNIVGKTPFPGSERWYYRYIMCHNYSKCITLSIKYVLHAHMCVYSYTCTYIHGHVHIYSYTATYSVLVWQGR